MHSARIRRFSARIVNGAGWRETRKTEEEVGRRLKHRRDTDSMRTLNRKGASTSHKSKSYTGPAELNARRLPP